LVAAREAGPRKRLRCLLLDDPRSVCLGNEPVRVDGRIVGRVTSGGSGYAVERSIAFAYLPPDAPIGTRGEIDVFGQWVGFEAVRDPLWAPAHPRLRSSARRPRIHGCCATSPARSAPHGAPACWPCRSRRPRRGSARPPRSSARPAAP